MALNPWRKVKSETKFKNPWWEYRFDNCTLPSGKKGEYHYVHTNGSVMIIPLFNNGKFLMVNQFRYLNSKESLEFPCGSIKDGDEIENTAHKELVEETGFDGELEKIGSFYPYNGITDEMTHVFVAHNLKPSNSASKDDSEEFESQELKETEIDQKIKEGEINDGMSMAAWSIFKNRLK